MPKLNRIPELGYLDWNFPSPIYKMDNDEKSYCLHLYLQLDNHPLLPCRPWESISFVNGEVTTTTGVFKYNDRVVSSEHDLRYIPPGVVLAAKFLSTTEWFREVRVGNSDFDGLINIQIAVKPSADKTIAFIRRPTTLLASLTRKMIKAIK